MLAIRLLDSDVSS